MIPKLYPKEHHPPPQAFIHFPPYAIPVVAPPMVREFHPLPDQIIAANANMETYLQSHRRKMQRRAANRKSAQLSRARKKAHLEELKTENTRLQKLVDVLDSQPELVFCATSTGKITYISERALNFIKINTDNDDLDDLDPTHISQILSKESVGEVLDAMSKLQQYSVNTSENDLNMLFSVKVVTFQDTTGRPVVGCLRCSKVSHRSSFAELQIAESTEKATTGPPNKKLKKSKNPSNESSTTTSSKDSENNSDKVQEPVPSWNLTNFNLLADCVSAMSENPSTKLESLPSKGEAKGKGQIKNASAKSTSSSNNNNPPAEVQNGKVDSDVKKIYLTDEEDEFVCVIRTSDDYFVPYKSSSDLLMFSSALSAESIAAHNLEATTTSSFQNGCRSESNNSCQLSSDAKTSSDQKSSETGSEDNNLEMESN